MNETGLGSAAHDGDSNDGPTDDGAAANAAAPGGDAPGGEAIARKAGFDLFVWSAPRDVDGEKAAALVDGWLAAGANPTLSPFELTTGIGWFYRELKESIPTIDALTDATPTGKAPIWMSATNEPPARVVALRLPRPVERDVLEEVYGLATKYDLVVFDASRGVVHRPLEEMSAYASATFWPKGAIQAATAGGAGAVIAVIAWFVGIPIVSGIAVIIGAFLFVMAVLTFVAEGRKRLRSSDPKRP